MSITLVQSKLGGSATNSGTGSLSTTTNSVGFNSTTTAGNLLLISIWINKQCAAFTALGGDAITITTPGISWTLAQGGAWGLNIGDPVKNKGGEIWQYYCQNAPSISTSVLTQVRALSSFVSTTYNVQLEFALFEFAGADTANVLWDNTGALNHEQSLSSPSTAASASNVGDLIFEMFVGDDVGGSYGAASTGFTLGPSASVCIGQTQYRTSPGGSNNCVWPAQQINWATNQVVYLAAAAVGPILQVTPTTLNYSGVAGGANPSPQNISITNGGGGTLNWSITSDQTWLTTAPTSGSGNTVVSSNVNTTGLAAGSYVGHLTVTAPGASGSPQTVTVNLTVTAPPLLQVSPATLIFTATQGGSNPAAQNVFVTNGGGGTLNWSVTSDQTWLTTSPTSGSGNGSFSTNINITGLVAGAYVGHLTVTAPGAGGSPQTVTVNLTIVSPAVPILQVSPTTLNFSGVEGGSNPASQNVSISNGNGGTLNWTIASDQIWLTAAPVSGTGNGTVTTNVNISGLVAGSYVGHLTVTAAGATGSPKIVTVNLIVGTPITILSVVPSSLTYTAVDGGANPSSQVLVVSNTGNVAPMNFFVVSDSLWSGITPASGNAGITPVTLINSINISGLIPGVYNGLLTVTAPGATGSPVIVPVTLTITSPTPPPPIAGTSRVLTQVDTWELDNGMENWPIETGKPKVWWETTLGQQQLAIAPAPDNVGQLGLMYVALARTLDGTGIALAVPDDWAPYILWGTLAELLSSDGPAFDPLRAQYCSRRYEEGIELARLVLGG